MKRALVIHALLPLTLVGLLCGVEYSLNFPISRWQVQQLNRYATWYNGRQQEANRKLGINQVVVTPTPTLTPTPAPPPVEPSPLPPVEPTPLYVPPGYPPPPPQNLGLPTD